MSKSTAPFTPVRAKVVTIVAPHELSDSIAREIKKAGVTGYTIARADGVGVHGSRHYGILDGANVRIETLVAAEVASRILELIDAKHAADAVIAYAFDVDAVPRNRFD